MTEIFVPVRPKLHYTPRRNWMNDPNGLIFHGGLYHLFYQYNPHGIVWGHMSWGHATSTDLLTWQECALALPEDHRHAIFSGSIVEDTQDTAGFGAGALVAIYTGHSDGPPQHQSQNLAGSTDGGSSWIKFAGNPVLDLGLEHFRDPKVFWHAPTQAWVMVVVLADLREIVFFASQDLKIWRELSRFGPAGTPGALWECPDLIPLPSPRGGLAWMLKVDVFRGAVAGGSGALAFIGDFDGVRFIPDSKDGAPLWQWVDYGPDFYAAASWTGLADRAVWIAWMNSHHYAAKLPEAGWRGSMTLPRELGLALRGGQLALTQMPVREWSAARTLHARVESVSRVDLPDSAFEIAVRDDPAPDFLRLRLVCADGGDVAITYDAAQARLSVDRSHAGAVPEFAGAASAELARLGSLRIVVDAGSVELFADAGCVAITEQFLGGPFRALEVEGAAVDLYTVGG